MVIENFLDTFRPIFSASNQTTLDEHAESDKQGINSPMYELGLHLQGVVKPGQVYPT
jgi:hypothetical protein